MDRVRNEEVCRRAGIKRELASRADHRVLRWFGHVERMDEYRMARRLLMVEVCGGQVRLRQRLGWMNGVKLALGNRGMIVEAVRQCVKDQKEWWYICNEIFFFCLALCSFELPFCALVVITWRGLGCRSMMR